jgi:hypothetical protein
VLPLPSARVARRALCALATLAGLLGAAAGASAEPINPSLTFPRTLGLYLQQNSLPGGSECNPPAAGTFNPGILARYDQVVIDMEWSNATRLTCYADGAGQNVFQRIRGAAARWGRGITIVPYINPVDRPQTLGSHGYYEFRYDLWGCKNVMTFGNCNFPAGWLAHNKKGQVYSEYNGTWMTNLTNQSPAGTMSVGSTAGTWPHFYSYFGQWVANQWNGPWAGKGYWDGTYLDVWGDRIWSNTKPWDPYWPAKKTDVSTDVIYQLNGMWQQGIAGGNAMIHGPTVGPPAPGTLVANNTQSTVTAPGLSGRLWESFADPALGRQFTWDVPPYVDASGPNPLGFATTPTADRNMILVDKSFSTGTLTATDFKRARYDLAAALLGNGYWGPSAGNYEGLPYFDEMDGGQSPGFARHGYLGAAIDPGPSWAKVSATYVGAPLGSGPGGGYTGEGSYGAGVYRRDFQNGIALVNSGTGTATINLAKPPSGAGNTYHHLLGTQAPSINNGQTVTSVTIPPNDGLILLNGPMP